MEKLFEIKTKYTFDEHMKFNFELVRNSKSTLVVRVIVFVILTFGIMENSLTWIILALSYPIIFLLLIYFRAKKLFYSNKASQDAEVTLEFYEDCIVQITDMGSYKIEHDKIAKVIETKTHFYIMISEVQGVIIPKASMPAEAEEYVRGLMKK